MARKMLIDGEVNHTNQVEEEAHFDFDLFVIGAGSGGVRAARFSANYGAKVGICELPFHPISSEVIGGVGGTCVIRGCVPKKILVYGANFGGEIEDAKNYGWELNEKVDYNWKKLLQKKTDEIIRLNGIYKRLLSNAGVKLYEGEGKIVGPNEVEVTQLDGTKLRYSAKHILIATGSRAQRLAIPGQELAITSDEALSLEDLPKRAVVFGGGYIAVEFASIWRGMGATVDLFFRKELPLRGFDDEMRAVVARNLEGRGINLHPRTNLTELTKTEKGIKIYTDHKEELLADVVLFATGNNNPYACYEGLQYSGLLKQNAIGRQRICRASIAKKQEQKKELRQEKERIDLLLLFCLGRSGVEMCLKEENEHSQTAPNAQIRNAEQARDEDTGDEVGGGVKKKRFSHPSSEEMASGRAGRAPNTKRLNLEAVGVELDNAGAVKVDEYSRTNIPTIWAVGDVTNRMNLTPVALMEGTCFAKTVFAGQPTKPDYNHIPCAVFSIPPFSVVGLSEEQALEQANGDVLVFTSSFNPMKNTISGRQEKTVMKLVVNAETDKVLGASMCGPDAPEVMQGIAVALKCGATKQQFDSTVGIHPSAAEEFVTMRSVTRRVTASGKPKANT
ncbi:hypothetical protein DKX38_000342 [Salix brachista]|uniref:glutathione-disulfide reductase n=1 Tax=Salix brachista TaxID=2182728 RepID=A0A5N5P210_9ROSI|nr:hypothetical protein DKX38_000342 [Salix brachista]